MSRSRHTDKQIRLMLTRCCAVVWSDARNLRLLLGMALVVIVAACFDITGVSPTPTQKPNQLPDLSTAILLPWRAGPALARTESGQSFLFERDDPRRLHGFAC
jgi:hypothetical protein